MQISLNEKFSDFVDERVRSGHFSSPEEVVQVALTLLKQQEVIDSLPRERLNQLIDEGERSIAEHGLLDAEEAFKARRERRAIRNQQ
jgi:putative addiction module CopG family antidote